MESRKRPLHSIDNTVDQDRRERKDGLRFTLARIDEDEPDQKTYLHKGSNIPLPPTHAASSTNSTSSTNGGTADSNPSSQAVKLGESTGPNINLKHINNLIGMNQTFKQSGNGPAKFVSDRGDVSNIVRLHEQILDLEIEMSLQRNRELAAELKLVNTKIDNLEIDISELKRNNKKFVAKLQDIKLNINSYKRKFEYLEEAIMKNVSNKEQLVNISVKESSNRLTAEMEEFKFELKNQLNIAKNFKDEDIIKKIEELTANKNELASKMDKLLQVKAEKIKVETIESDKQLAKFLEQKMDRSEGLSKEYEQKQEELNNLNKSFEELQNNITSLKQENVSIQSQIEILETSGNDFINVKSELLTKIETLELNLSKLSSVDNEFSTKLGQTDEIYDEICQKVAKHENTKLILENSILNYLPQFCRIYVNVPTDVESLDNSFNVNGHHYKFDKVLKDAVQQTILAQLKYFVSTNILNNNLSFVLSGNNDSDLFASIIFNSYKQILATSKMAPENLTLNCKAIEITDGSTYDVLNSSQIVSNQQIHTPNDIMSQIMLLDDPENFKLILKNTTMPSSLDFKFSCKFYTINLKGEFNHRLIDSNISFLNVSNNAIPQQADFVALKSNPVLESVFKYFRLTKCFHLCQMTDLSNTSLLDSLAGLH